MFCIFTGFFWHFSTSWCGKSFKPFYAGRAWKGIIIVSIFQVQIKLGGSNSSAQILGPYFRGQVPLDDILRKFHLRCCQNVERETIGDCPTLGWKYPWQMLNLNRILDSQANHLLSEKVRLSQDPADSNFPRFYKWLFLFFLLIL